MKTKKLLVFLTMGALVALLALAGCGGNQQSSEPAPQQNQGTTQQAPQQDQGTTQQAPQQDQGTAQDQGTTQQAPQQDQGAAQNQGTAPANDTANYIGNQAALDAAMAHAGVAASDCTNIEVELDSDDMPVHYDVGFHVGTTEYDYDIDASTGNVVSYGSEVDND